MSNFDGDHLDLTGKRFGKLTVVKEAERVRGLHAWECICDCGNTSIVPTASLRTGNTKSCGCLSKSHGGSGTRLYIVWTRMMDRCYRTKTERYKNYGARGITVCDDWHDFSNFRDWAMQSGYDPQAKRYDCTLDRIDVNGNYEPSNCRWITMKEQSQNTTRSHFVTVNGETLTLSQASEKYDISAATIWARLMTLGWDDENAVLTPIQGRNKNAPIPKRS